LAAGCNACGVKAIEVPEHRSCQLLAFYALVSLTDCFGRAIAHFGKAKAVLPMRKWLEPLAFRERTTKATSNIFHRNAPRMREFEHYSLPP
jgi:hypothetical protein